MIDWTFSTIFAYFTSLLAEQDRRYNERFIAQEQAILKAEESTEKRLAGLNELRSTMSDQQATYMTRVEADARFRSINDKIDLIITRIDKAEGKDHGLQAGWGYLLGAIGGLIGIIGIISAIITILS